MFRAGTNIHIVNNLEQNNSCILEKCWFMLLMNVVLLNNLLEA